MGKNKPYLKEKDADLEGRESFQKSEGYKESTSSYPDQRLQKDKQVLTPAELGVDKESISGGIAPSRETTIAKAATKIRSNVTVKPDSAVDIEDGKQIGGVPLGANIATRNFAGAGAQSPADDMSRNPHTRGGYRPTTRLGKKISEQNFEINNTISEQVSPVYDESKDLRESPDSVMGYNGRKQFKQSRGKKNAGNVPQSLLYDRSADILYHDEIVYTGGQILDSIPDQAGYPTRSYVGTAASGADELGYADVPNPLIKGNYSLDSMKIVIKDGLVDGISFYETRFVPATTYKERDISNMNWQVDMNNNTQSMVNMQTKLGRETSDKWSPLAYVVEQPYQVNMLYHDMENTIGAITAACYRAGVSSISMQLNMLGKDGAKPVQPAVNSALSTIGNIDNPLYLGVNPELRTVFNAGLTSLGVGTAITAMFDSVNKYATKADIWTMQRSMKLVLSQADNNMNPFHCKKNFIKALNTAHTFSTVSGDYNPNLPVYVTKKVKLVNQLSLQYFLEGWKNPASADFDSTTNDPTTGCPTKFKYSYNDLRNRYTMPIRNPFVEGLCRWILIHQNDLAKAFGKNKVISMDCNLDFTNPTLFELMVCAATQDIAFMRNTFFRDILFAGEQDTYIWNDLTTLKELNPLWSDQLQIKAYDSPLGLGKLRDASKIRLLWPETFAVASEQAGDGGVYSMPWYMNEQSFSASPDLNGSWLNDDSSATMTMPSIRSGVRHEYVDVLYTLSEVDVRLAMDRMITIPNQDIGLLLYGDTSIGYTPIGGTYVDNIHGNTASNCHLRALRYDSNSDGRLSIEYDDDLSYAALMCAPRELGWITPGLACDHVHIVGVTVKNGNYPNDGTATITFDSKRKVISDAGYYAPAYDSIVDGSTSWQLMSYYALGNGVDVTAASIDTTAAIQQDFVAFYASRSPDEITANTEFINSRHFAPTLSAIMTGGSITTINPDTATVNPIYGLHSIIASTEKFFSIVPTLWGILNRVFFAVNPFENCLVAGDTDEAKAGALVDPMENAFLFGVSGTLASDYNQHALERLDNFDQLNLNYLEDEFVRQSPIFRE